MVRPGASLGDAVAVGTASGPRMTEEATSSGVAVGPDSAAPVVNGRYRVVAELDPTRLGRRSLAEDTVSGDRVVLTVLTDELAADAEFAAAFRRESQAAVLPTLPGAARVRAYEITPEGTLVLITEEADARTLEEELHAHPAPELGRSLWLAIQLGQALEQVHNAGFAHGDLRPGNVLLVGDPERVELRGLELAPMWSLGALDRWRRRAPTDGNRHYQAPEQLERGDIDERADLYAFGAIVHRLLRGHAPGETTGAPRELPRRLERILRATLVTDPGRRPDVTAVVNDLWDETRRMTSGPAGGRGIGRRRLVLSGGLLVVAALGLALAVGRGGGIPPASVPAGVPAAAPGPLEVAPEPVTSPAPPVAPPPSPPALSPHPPVRPPAKRTRQQAAAQPGAPASAPAARGLPPGPRAVAGSDSADPGAIIDWLLGEGASR
jgi:eukaryotic-like serine/threonine-protein kinase